MVKIGILAIQGGFSEHETAFKRCMLTDEFANKNIDLDLIQIRSKEDITSDLNGIVLPGGESTAMGRILNKDNFGEQLKSFVEGRAFENCLPYVWGTCSGMIMLANNLNNQKKGGQYHMGGIDITVSRNFFGRQVNSFESPVILNQNVFPNVEDSHGVFIRAPAVLSCDSPDVEVLGTIEVDAISHEPVIVAVRQKRFVVSSFHPELTEDLMWHRHFLNMVIFGK